MLVQHLRELLHRGFAEAQFAHHFDAGVRFQLQFMFEPRDFVARADEDEPALVLGLGELAVQSPPYQFLLQINQGETDDAKKHHHNARRKKVEGVHDQHQADGRDEASFEERPENVPPRAKGGPVVKALRFKNQRPGNNQGEVKPDDPAQGVGWNRVEVQPLDDLRVGAQRKRNPEARREQTGIRYLVDLRSNLAFTSRHDFLTPLAGYF